MMITGVELLSEATYVYAYDMMFRARGLVFHHEGKWMLCTRSSLSDERASNPTVANTIDEADIRDLMYRERLNNPIDLEANDKQQAVDTAIAILTLTGENE